MLALFQAVFDDTKGQILKQWKGDLEPGHIEQTVLPSGLHHVDEDIVVFRHQGHLGIGLFTSRDSDEGRGRIMGTDILQYVPFLQSIEPERLDEFWNAEYGKPSTSSPEELLEAVGPLVVPIMRAAKQGKRIILYAPPPIHALASHAITIASLANVKFHGNIGLIDLDSMGPGIASTSPLAKLM